MRRLFSIAVCIVLFSAVAQQTEASGWYRVWCRTFVEGGYGAQFCCLFANAELDRTQLMCTSGGVGWGDTDWPIDRGPRPNPPPCYTRPDWDCFCEFNTDAPHCEEEEEEEDPKCPEGQVGTPPNCTCPAGGTPPDCCPTGVTGLSALGDPPKTCRGETRTESGQLQEYEAPCLVAGPPTLAEWWNDYQARQEAFWQRGGPEAEFTLAMGALGAGGNVAREAHAAKELLLRSNLKRALKDVVSARGQLSQPGASPGMWQHYHNMQMRFEWAKKELADHIRKCISSGIRRR